MPLMLVSKRNFLPWHVHSAAGAEAKGLPKHRGVLLIFEVHLQDCVPFSGDLAKSVPAAVGKADPHGAKERNIILVRAEVVESSC